MRHLPVASALVTVVVTVTAISGCFSAASGAEQNAGADVKVGVCAMGEPSELQDTQVNSASCAITVNNRAGSMRAYTINLTCTSSERTTPFAAGSMLYYVPAGQHTISSAGIVTSGTDQNIICRTRSAKARDLTSDDGSPEPWPSPSGALAEAAAGPDATPEPELTAADADASASARAGASQSAAAKASASAALADLQHRALVRTYTLGDYTVNLTNVDPSGYDVNDQQLYIAGTVTSHSADTGTMKQFGLVVTLLRANGSVDTRGTLCVELMGGTSDVVNTTTDGGTPDWTSIRITRSPATPC
jgi:hypothetical protein